MQVVGPQSTRARGIDPHNLQHRECPHETDEDDEWRLGWVVRVFRCQLEVREGDAGSRSDDGSEQECGEYFVPKRTW